MKRREALITLGGGLALLAAPRSASAWVPPADFLLKRIHHRRKNMEGASIHGRLVLYGDDLPGGQQAADQTLHLKAPDVYRLEIVGPQGRAVELGDGRRHARVMDGKVQRADSDIELWFALLVGNPPVMTAAARGTGVALDRVSLGRLDGPDGQPQRGEICYVVGADAGDEEPAQIWVSKDTYQPRLVKEAGPVSSARYVAFDQWDSEIGRGWVPGLTTRRRGKELLKTFQAEKVEINPKFSAGLFDPSKL